ncbi:MAG: hypothetical protein ACM3YN_08450 [Parcubacteria group bacterium]
MLEDPDLTEAETPDEQELGEIDAPEEADSLQRLMQFAQAEGDVSHLLSAQELAKLGSDVVADWKRDDESRSEWKTKVEAALRTASQEDGEVKSYPWDSASNVKHPILTVASQQFAARAYPAIVKGDEAVKIKVLGDAPPPAPPDAMQAAQAGDPQAGQMVQMLMAAHQRYAAKHQRAGRVETYLNWRLFYGMDDWESDTDAMLHNLPITGMAFRKVYYDRQSGGTKSEFVNALRLTVPMESQSLKRCPRITQDLDLYPYEIAQKQRAGTYREITLHGDGEDEQAPRLILEQHRLHDLAGVGFEQPYIVTVDEQTTEVLRIDAAFSQDDVEMDPNTGEILNIRRWVPFVKYPFLPDPKGRAYAIGFGHLLAPLSEVINTAINQLIDAGHAQVAGGGFVAAGLRLQGAGQTAVLRFKPGEYKTVNASGQDIRNAIVDRTVPNPSPVLFQLLDLVLGAAREIASVKDVLTGDTPSTAPVGTTLALIEQGLQVFTSIYKRIYRSLREEFQLMYECERRYGDPQAYMDVLDDPQANFEQDFSPDGKDIVPVSDPSAVTKMQALAKAQALQPFLGQPFANSPKIFERILDAIDIDNPEELVAQPPQGPPPGMLEQIDATKAKAVRDRAAGLKDIAQAAQIERSHDTGGLPGMEGPSGDGMGPQGGPDGGQPPAGGMEPPLMGPGAGGPAGPY